MRDLELLTIISKNRGCLMGLAILWIFLFHSGVIGKSMYDTIISYGYLGVDLFFFLSGFGVAYSLSKDSSTQRFYKRRLIRIIPTWWLFLITVNILGIVSSSYSSHSIPYPSSFTQLFSWYTGLGYWIKGSIPHPENYYYEWYIPTLMLFYLCSPLFFRSKSVLLLIAAIILKIAFKEYNIFHDVFMSWTRIDVFILGFVVFKIGSNNSVKTKNEWRIPGSIIHKYSNWILVSGLLLVGICVYFFANSFFKLFIPLFFILPFVIICSKVIEGGGENSLYIFNVRNSFFRTVSHSH